MPMTAYQRHMAAVKAAATKRARKAQQQANGGYAPPPPRPQPSWTPPSAPPSSAYTPPPPPPPPSTGFTPTAGNLWGTPKPSAASQRLVVLAALEDFLAVKVAETGITQEQRDAWEKYKKVKTTALSLRPDADTTTRNEADTALRVAAMALIRLTF